MTTIDRGVQQANRDGPVSTACYSSDSRLDIVAIER
jgi:hypothetical protein